MKRIVSLAIVAAILVGLAVGGWWWGTLSPLPPIDQSVARYVTEEACAACLIRPQGLSKHPWFGSLPFYWYLPPSLSPGRLEKLGIKELAIFAIPSEMDEAAPAAALAAKLSQPADVPQLVRQWRASSVVPQEDDSPPAPIQLEGYGCFQLPAGTVFPRRYASGTLLFTDRTGLKAFRGIHVGKTDNRRQFIEGNTKTSAIFTLRNIGESDLVDDKLPLELRPGVFLVTSTPPELQRATVTLRNPSNGLSSPPIELPIVNLRNHRIDFPRKIAVEKQGERREVDLLDELVSEGRLEVVVTCPTSLVYLGFASDDLNVWRPEFEYAYASGDEVLVAESRDALVRMIQTATNPLPLATSLSRTRGEAVAEVNLKSAEQRRAWRAIASELPAPLSDELWRSRLAELRAAIDLNASTAVSVQASFDSPVEARDVKVGLDVSLSGWKSMFPLLAEQRINRETAANSLIGTSLGAYLNELLGAHSRDDMVTAMKATIGDSLENVHVTHSGSYVTIRFRPPASLRNLSATAQFAIAMNDMSLANALGEFDRIDQEEEVFQRVTDLLPQSLSLRTRRSQQLAFQSRFRLNQYEDQYAAFRRGAEVLLDAVENDPDQAPEALWILGVIITRQSLIQSRYVAFRELFQNDVPFQQRLQRSVDLATARGLDDRIDLHLVGKRCMEEAIRRKPAGDVGPLIFPPEFFAGPALAQAECAECLTELNRLDEALAAWTKADQMLQELGRRTWEGGEFGAVDLDHWKDSLTEEELTLVQANAAGYEPLALGPKFDYWRARAELEATGAMQPVHQAYAPLRDAMPIVTDLDDPALSKALLAMTLVVAQHPEKIEKLYAAYQLLGMRSPIKRSEKPTAREERLDFLIGIERD